VLGRAMSNSDSQDSPRPGLGGSHHLPPYSTMCLSTRPTSKWHFVLGLPNGSPEIAKVEIPATLRAHNFMCKPRTKMRSKAKLYSSLRTFQRDVARHLHIRKSGQFLTLSGWESNCQFVSLLLAIAYVSDVQMVMRAHFRHLRFNNFFPMI